jgi:tripartite-type tricarboxylate transporter receptor subunit TctC
MLKFQKMKFLFGAAVAGLAVNAVAQPDAYPSRPIHFVVGFAPGGGTDILARVVAEPLARRLGQPVIVENLPGASGGVASIHVKNAAADGYTLLIGASGAMAINPAVQSKLNYDPVKDFTPVTVLGTYPIVFTARPGLPIKTTKELIERAKSSPGSLTFGGAGVLFQLTGELFNQQAGVSMTFVPYKGTAPATAAVMGGEIDLLVADIAPVAPLIAANRIQPIAITSATRSKILPNVPTVAESGLAGYNVDVFVGLFAKAGTPAPIVDHLYREIAAVLAEPGIKEKLEKIGISPAGISPTQTASMLKSEIGMYTAAARKANVKID